MKNKTIALLPLFIIAAMLILRLASWDAYVHFLWEDGPVEYLQALMYVISSALAFLIALNFWPRKKLLGVLMTIGGAFLFLVGMEEISWGQRIFQIGNPEFFAQNNYQKELNIHNLSTFQVYLHTAYMIFGFGLATAHIWLKYLAGKFPKLLGDFYKYLTPPSYLALYFLPVALHYFIYDYFRKPLNSLVGFETIQWQDQEVHEFLLTLGMLMLLFIVRKRSRPAA